MKKPIVKITVLTLFPDFINDYTKFGIIQRAIKNKLIQINSLNLREFGLDARQTVDDRPYGGGVGMVLRPDVLYKAIVAWKKKQGKKKTRVILMSPQGNVFGQKKAKDLTKYDSLLFVSGRYEGFDERILKFVDEEISIGDYVLMGGELPALVITETLLRFVPGVVGKMESTESESFSEGLLEYPQYTKPEVWKFKRQNSKGETKIINLKVPEVLRSGNHVKISEWRKNEAIKKTNKRRPDLITQHKE